MKDECLICGAPLKYLEKEQRNLLLKFCNVVL